jgi:hypothetical protein
MARSDETFLAFSRNSGGLRDHLTPNNSISRALHDNPAFLDAYLAEQGTAYSLGERDRASLIERSPEAARALIEFGQWPSLPLAARLAADPPVRKPVMAALLTTRGRMEAAGVDTELVDILDGVPGLAEELAAHPETAADSGTFRRLLGNADLLREFSEHRPHIGVVVGSPRALKAALRAPGLVRAIAAVPEALHGRLLGGDVLDLVESQPEVVSDLADDAALRTAVLTLPELPRLLLADVGLLGVLREKPLLVEALLKHRMLVGRIAGDTAVWPVVKMNPALVSYGSSCCPDWSGIPMWLPSWRPAISGLTRPRLNGCSRFCCGLGLRGSWRSGLTSVHISWPTPGCGNRFSGSGTSSTL